MLVFWALGPPVYTSVTTLAFAQGSVYPRVSFLKVGALGYSTKHNGVESAFSGRSGP